MNVFFVIMTDSSGTRRVDTPFTSLEACLVWIKEHAKAVSNNYNYCIVQKVIEISFNGNKPLCLDNFSTLNNFSKDNINKTYFGHDRK